MLLRTTLVVASIGLWATQAHAGTCGLDADDCDGDGYDNAVDLCPFTASVDNSQTTVTYNGTSTPLPTGAACTHSDVVVEPTANLGHGVELGSGATVLNSAYVGDFAVVGGLGEAAVVATRAVLVDAPTPEQGISFPSGVLGSRANVGIDPDLGPGGGREGGVVTGTDLSVSRSVSIGFGVHLGDNVVLGYGSTIGPNAFIADNVTLGSLVDVGFGSIVGDGTVLARGVSIGSGSQLGDNVVVGPNVQIGNGTLIGGTDGMSETVRIRKDVIIGSCVALEEGASVGRGASIGDYGRVGQGTDLSSQVDIEAGGEACTDGLTRAGTPCQGDYTRSATVGGDASFTECPEIVTPTPDVDLTVSNVVVAGDVPAGFLASLSVSVNNAGIDRSTAAWLAVSWSSTNTWEDPEACRVEVGPIGGGQSRTIDLDCAAPATPGSYRLVARIDATDAIPETDEGNNDDASLPMTVLEGVGACGNAHLASTDNAPSTDLCAYGTESSVSGSGPYTWTCTDDATGTVSACESNRSCISEPLTWTRGGSECTTQLSGGPHADTLLGVDNDLPTSGNQSYTCDQGTWVAQGAGECDTAVDAVCGAADGTTALNAPSSQLCAAGNATTPAGSGPYTWSCEGLFQGEDAQCTSDRSCAGGTQSWQVGASACNASVDTAGHSVTSTAADGDLPTSGSRDYTCNQGVWNGVGTGACVTAVDAVCGSANGQSFQNAPSTGLCADGTPGVMSGDGPFTWTCSGIDGGSNASCSSDKTCTGASQSWTVNGSTCSASVSTVAHSGSSTATDSGLPTSGSRTYTCNQGDWSGSGAGSCVTAVDGACGTANNASTAGTPSSGLCSAGAATSVTGSGPYSWSCVGTDGGTTDTCSSNRSCADDTLSWTDSASTCSSGVAAIGHSGSRSLSDSGLPTTGSQAFACNQGTWQVSGAGSCVTAVDAVCGSADGQSFVDAPTTGLCADGTPGVMNGDGPFTWTCSGINGGDDASCSSDKTCSATTHSWSVSGSTCAASVSTVAHNGSSTATDSALPTTGSRTYTCSQGDWSGSGTGSCVTAVNGACGGANGASTTSAPSSSLCSAGNATGVSGSGPYSWSCVGTDGGTTASCNSNRSCSGTSRSWSYSGSSCSASVSTVAHSGTRTATDSGLPTTGSQGFSCSQGSWSQSGAGSCVTAVDAVCGSANGGSFSSTPASGLCADGNASAVSGSGPYSWTCQGINGGSNTSCSANRSCSGTSQSWTVSGSTCSDSISTVSHGGSQVASDGGLPTTGSRTYTCSQGSWSGSGSGSCVTAVNGSCGSANGGSTTSAPSTSTRCSSGSASGVSGSGPYTWTCAGSNGGSSASCSSNRSCSGITGSWTLSGSTCSASVATTSHGSSRTVSDSGQPTTGSRNFSCSQGSFSQNGGSCVTQVNGSCGSSNGGSFTSKPSSGLCSAGSASSVGGSGPWSWTCSGQHGGTTASCGANESCGTQSVSWTVSGSSCSGSVAANNHGQSRTASDSGQPTTGSRTYVCSQGSWSGSGTGTCITRINGSCGSANGGSTTSAPSTSTRCSAGNATGVSGSGPYTWSCTGINGGSTASCSSNRSCSGITGSWTLGGSTCSASVATTSHGSSRNAVDSGQPTTGTRTFSCGQGTFLQSGGSCVTQVNGSCGSAESGSSTSAPTSSLCTAGSASSVSIASDGRWAWTCGGSNGGSTDTCRKNRSCSSSTVSWSSCQRGMSAQASGYSASLSNTRSGYTGSATITCSQGTWLTSNTSCQSSQVCSPGSTRSCWASYCPCEGDGTQTCNLSGSAWGSCVPFSNQLCYGGGGGCF